MWDSAGVNVPRKKPTACRSFWEKRISGCWTGFGWPGYHSGWLYGKLLSSILAIIKGIGVRGHGAFGESKSGV